jgi:hypothetical protein
MEILVRHAMQDPIFAETVRAEGWFIIRENIYGEEALIHVLHNPHVAKLNSELKNVTGDPDARAIGVKRGGNPYANATGVAMGTLPSLGQPPVAAVNLGTEIFKVPVDGDLRTLNNVDMMAVALSRCDGSTVVFTQAPPATATFEPLIRLQAVPADEDSNHAAGAQFNEDGDDTEGEDVFVEAYRVDVADAAANVDLVIQHLTEFEMPPGQRVTFGIAPYDAHGGIRIRNLRGTISYDITTSHPVGVTSVVLADGEWHDVPADTALGSPSFTMTLENTARSDTALVEVGESGYLLQVDLPGGIGSMYSATLQRDATMLVHEQMSVAVLGRDGTPGNTIEGPGHEGIATPPQALITETRAYPNPFNPAVTIEYDLERRARASVTVFDVTGRRIRALQPERVRAAGTHRVVWDGRDSNGTGVATGAYFYVVRAEGARRSGALVLVR